MLIPTVGPTVSGGAIVLPCPLCVWGRQVCFGVQAPVKERFLKLHRRDYIMVGNGRIRRCKKCVLTFKSIGRSVSMSAWSSPKVGWKSKWSNGVGKSEMSIIWCISIANNVKAKKKSMKQLKRPTSLIFHWFHVEMVHNGPKLRKRKRNVIWKLTSRAFWKCGGFCCYNF